MKLVSSIKSLNQNQIENVILNFSLFVYGIRALGSIPNLVWIFDHGWIKLSHCYVQWCESLFNPFYSRVQYMQKQSILSISLLKPWNKTTSWSHQIKIGGVLSTRIIGLSACYVINWVLCQSVLIALLPLIQPQENYTTWENLGTQSSWIVDSRASHYITIDFQNLSIHFTMSLVIMTPLWLEMVIIFLITLLI